MPEEINRVLTDQISDLLFIHSPEARDNLVCRGSVAGARARGRQHDDRHPRGDALADRRDARGAATRAEPWLVPGRHAAPAGAGRRPAARRRGGRARRGRRGDAGRVPRSIRAPRRRWSARACRSRRRACACSSRWATSSSSAWCRMRPACSPTPAGCRRRRPISGIPCFTLRDNTERPITCELGTNVLLGLAPSASERCRA